MLNYEIIGVYSNNITNSYDKMIKMRNLNNTTMDYFWEVIFVILKLTTALLRVYNLRIHSPEEHGG